MKPPICCICHVEFGPNEGGLIYFTKTKSDIEWEKKMKKIKGTGHPPYVEWFCQKHYLIAKELSHLTKGEAIKFIRSKE